MYKRFYGFTRPPFDLTPDPDRVFMSETHKEGLAILKYGVVAKKGFLVLTGPVGTGKTTLLQALTNSLEGNVHCCLLTNPTLARDEFFALLAYKYGLAWTENKALFLIQFAEFLKECSINQEQVLLIVDEAHVISVDLLEEIRLLSNQDLTGGDVFSIFLVGQPELNAHLSNERLLPLRQRIGIRFHLELFTRDVTVQYVAYRLRTAGGKHLDIFTDEALTLIHKVSKGTPRLINIVCDHALLTGYANEKWVIDEAVIRECVDELHFPGESNPLPVAPEQKKYPRVLCWLSLFFLVGGVLLASLVALEVIPVTRTYSPLNNVLPESWLQWLHHLYDIIGGE
jgi:general secretion pathway protein A